MGVPLGIGGNGSRGYPHHMGVHQETAGDHSGKGGLPPHIQALRKSEADAGDKLDGAMVGPGHSK